MKIHVWMLPLILLCIAAAPARGSGGDPSPCRNFIRDTSKLILQQKYDEAEKEISRRSGEIRKEEGRCAEASVLLLRGLLSDRTHRGPAPDSLWKEALALFRDEKEHWGEGVTLLRWGTMEKDRGRSEEGEHMLAESASLLEEEKDYSLSAVAWIQIFNICCTRKDDSGVNRAIEKAAALFEKAQDMLRVSACHSQWSDYYYSRGLYEKALPHQKKAVEIIAPLSQPSIEAKFLMQQANILSCMGKDADALASLDRALALPLDDADLAQIHTVKGDTFLALQRFREAGEQYGLAFEIYHKGRALSSEGDTLVRLSDIYGNTGETEKREKALHQALDAYRNAGSAAGEARVRRMLGDIYFSAGTMKKAEQEYQKAMALSSAAGDPIIRAECLSGAGRQYFFLGDYRRAEAALLESVELFNRAADASSKTSLVHALNSLGDLFIHTGEYRRAQDYVANSLAISREINFAGGEISARDVQAALFLSMGNARDALETLKKSLELAQNRAIRSHSALIHLSIGRCYEYLGEPAEARKHYEASLKLNEEAGFRKGCANDHLNLGFFSYYIEGNSERAEEHLKKSLEIYRSLQDRMGITAALEMLGCLYRHRGLKEQALRCFSEALDVARKAGDEAEEQSLRYLTGLYRFHEGEVEKGLAEMECCARYYKEHQMDLEYAGTLCHLSGIYLVSLGQREKAAQYNKLAWAIYLKKGDRNGALQCMFTESRIKRDEQKRDLSRKALQDALEEARKLGNNAMICTCLRTLAAEEETVKRKQKYAEELVSFSEKSGDPFSLILALNQSASLLIRHGEDEEDISKAEQYLDSAYRAASAFSRRDLLDDVLLLRARLLDRRGRTGEALEMLKSALKESGGRPGMMTRLHLDILGINAGRSGESDYESIARASADALFSMLPRLADHRVRLVSFFSLFPYYRSHKDYSKCMKLVEDSIAWDEAHGNQQYRWHFLLYGALAAEEMKDRDRAISYYTKAVEAGEELLQGFINDETLIEASLRLPDMLFSYHLSPCGGIMEPLMEKKDFRKAFALCERDRAQQFRKRTGSRVWPRIPEARVNEKIMDQIRDMKKCAGLFNALSASVVPGDLALDTRSAVDGSLALALRRGGPEPSGERRARAFTGTGQTVRSLPREYVNQYKSLYMEILSLMRLEDEEYCRLKAVDPASLEEIQACLSPDSLLVQYYADTHALYIFTVTTKEIKGRTVAAEGLYGDLRKKTAEFRRLIEKESGSAASGYSESLRTKASDLYRTLILPIEGDMAGIKRLIIVPHRELHELPFAALLDGSGSPLCMSRSLSYLPSASTLPLCRKKKKSPAGTALTAFALGNMQVGTYSTLPGSKEEVQKLAALYPEHDTAFEEDFTRTRLIDLAPRASLLHLATHGVLDQSYPVFSGIVTADGLFTVEDIFQDLRLDNCRLATLSACQTALGARSPGDDMIGISRALIYAGAPTVVASLWSVSDESTALLMLYFYQCLKEGDPCDDALSKAQQRLMQDYPHPWHWAPFIVIGDR